MKSKSPGVLARINRLKYPQKFTLISLLFLLPLLAFIPIISEQITRVQQYGYDERYGTYYLQPLQDLLEHVQEHNRLAVDLSLNLATPDQLEAVREKIRHDFDQLEVYDAQYADALQLTSELSDLKTQWNALVENDQPLKQAEIIAASS